MPYIHPRPNRIDYHLLVMTCSISHASVHLSSHVVMCNYHVLVSITTRLCALSIYCHVQLTWTCSCDYATLCSAHSASGSFQQLHDRHSQGNAAVYSLTLSTDQSITRSHPTNSYLLLFHTVVPSYTTSTACFLLSSI